MANFSSSRKPSPLQTKPSKYYTHFLCKPLIVMFVLVLLPLFPSQAPDFVNQTILTKLWELLHLLFIGIAVCYGLFSRRNDDMNTETHSIIDNSQNYMPGILRISSIFEDGIDSPCGSEERRMRQIYESQYLGREPLISNASSVLNEWNNPRSSGFGNEVENLSGSYEKEVIQTWNSQHLQGEPMVVTQDSHGIDHWGMPRASIEFKPLGLPIRSLRSRVVENNTADSCCSSGSNLGSSGSCGSASNPCLKGSSGSGSNSGLNGFSGSGSNSGLKGSSGNGSNSGLNGSSESSMGSEPMRERKMGMNPTNLEEKFKESAVLSSPIPWCSRSGRMQVREGVAIKFPSHSRPLSVGEFEFKHLKSQSFRSPRSSGCNSISSSPKRVSPSSSIYMETPNSGMEYLGGDKSLHGSSEPPSESHSASVNGEESFSSPSVMKWQRSSEDNLKDFCEKEKDELGREDCSMDSLNSNISRTTLRKGLSRGKSVRTIRPSDNVARRTGEFCADRIHKEAKKARDKYELVYNGNTGKISGQDAPLLYARKQNPSNPKAEKHGFAKGNMVESEEDSESEFKKFHLSSDEEVEVESEIVNEADPDPTEVDRKASEFIAKFREQIRLQKIAATRGLSS